MNTKEYVQLLELPPQEYCEKIYELFPQNTRYAYKTETPFDECKSDDIVYIPERSYKELPIEITYYTKQDLIEICDESKGEKCMRECTVCINKEQSKNGD